ncbi:MAG TPA: hypothetical protein VFB62_20460 [Polyangiaceae bacterium]|nr:hypothetical protein [Polyangiaceae bacterium]
MHPRARHRNARLREVPVMYIDPRKLVRRRVEPTLTELAWMALADLIRPRTRGECPSTRPCPFVACKMHLYTDVEENGAIRINFPDLQPDELEHSCALDLAEQGAGVPLEHLGDALNVSRERARQLVAVALRKYSIARHGVEPVSYSWESTADKRRAGQLGAAKRHGKHAEPEAAE